MHLYVCVRVWLEEVKKFHTDTDNRSCNGLEGNLTMAYSNTLSLKVNTKIFQVSVLMLSSPHCIGYMLCIYTMYAHTVYEGS